MYQMIVGRHPFWNQPSNSPLDLTDEETHRVVSSNINHLTPVAIKNDWEDYDVGHELQHLVGGLLKKNPRERMTMYGN